MILMLTHRDPWFGVSAGFVALCLNSALVMLVSLLARAPRTDSDASSGTFELRPSVG
jgi:hypothetical protein